jgi:serine/threonine protein kinase
MPLGLGLEIGQQLLHVLSVLHKAGIVHGDVSPDKIMLTQTQAGEPEVKLIDLGLAKALEGDTGATPQRGIFLGLLRYISPERFTSGRIDVRSDLYSFAVVLYEILTGHHPIRGEDPSAVIADHLFSPPMDFSESDPAGKIPPGVRAVLLRALTKDPEGRFPSAQELSQVMDAFRRPNDIAEGDLTRALSLIPLAVPNTDPIDELYATLSALYEKKEASPQDRRLDDLITQTLHRLRTAQADEVVRLRSSFESGLRMPWEAGAEILREVQRMREEDENPATNHIAAQPPDDPEA